MQKESDFDRIFKISMVILLPTLALILFLVIKP